MTLVQYTSEPSKYAYMALPDGKADVWLRKNITEVTEKDEDGNKSTHWEAEEVYFRTSYTEEEVVENFDAIFEAGGTTEDEDTGEEIIEGVDVTTADRLDAIEAAISELADMVAGLAEE